MCTLTTFSIKNGGGNNKPKGKGKDLKKELTPVEKVMAVPVNSKLPWMEVDKIPAEFLQDQKDGKKVGSRYYIA